MSLHPFLPRPEYPRPDRQRGFVHGLDWLNLNGSWEFRFDGERRGLEEKWFEPGEERWLEQIIVPFCWESLAAWGEADSAGNDHFFSTRPFRAPLEITTENHRGALRYEVGWYRRRIIIPSNEHWTGQRVMLTIGAADFRTDGWCNGHSLGTHEDGYTPFEFDLTDHLENLPDGTRAGWLVFRVEDPMDNREQPVGKQWGWYSSASGIWQTVFVEPRAAAFIERFEVTPQIGAEQILLRAWTSAPGNLQIEITAPNGKIFTRQMTLGSSSSEVAIPLAPVQLWDPHDPQLYRLRLTFGGERPDVVHGYFGMRSLAAAPAAGTAPAALIFNGKPIYLRGALYQSYHPAGVYTAGDLETLRHDIAEAQRFGFDFLRVHIKIDDPLLLHLADTMGMLLMTDFPNFGEGGDTELGRARFEKMMRAAIQRDFNHPSIIAWCLFNETWGFGGQAEFVSLINPGLPPLEPTIRKAGKIANTHAWYWIEKMWQLAKSLDGTRLIEDMSVVAWNHLQYYGHGDTDVNSWHFYTHDYAYARQHIAEVVKETYAGSSFNYVPGFKQGSQPLINSEYGGIGALDGDRDVSWSFKFLTNELRRHAPLSAYIYTELHDVEWERNGFLNYDRTPKEFGYDPRMINAGDVLPIDAPPIQKCSAGSEVELDVYSSHFSRRERGPVTLHWTLSGIDSVGWIEDELLTGSQPIDFPAHEVPLAARLKFRLPDRIMLCNLLVRAVDLRGQVLAENYVQIFSAAEIFPEQEQQGKRRILRFKPEDWSEASWPDGQSDRATAAREGFCFGEGCGWFEWAIPVGEPASPLSLARVLCEISARREGTPQTDSFVQQSSFDLLLNGVLIQRGTLPNHPHDARGALSYLRGAKGAYGFLIHASVEGELLRQVCAKGGSHWRLRCVVPRGAEYPGGLTIYAGDCGRYPVPPTLIIE